MAVLVKIHSQSRRKPNHSDNRQNTEQAHHRRQPKWASSAIASYNDRTSAFQPFWVLLAAADLQTTPALKVRKLSCVVLWLEFP
jgi:hypothetical protein